MESYPDPALLVAALGAVADGLTGAEAADTAQRALDEFYAKNPNYPGWASRAHAPRNTPNG